MQYRLTAPKSINTRISLPASKSISARALIINALSHSSVQPDNVSDCDDTRAMLAGLNSKSSTIDVGAAGTAMRFLAAYFAVQRGRRVVITGSERMKRRPIAPLVEALRQLGADIEYCEAEGYPPLLINGRQLRSGEIAIQGNISSQYVSALLMIAPLLPEGLNIKLSGDVVSRPYIDMTLSIMRDFGAQACWKDASTLAVAAVPYGICRYVVENDWSAASYWYEMAALVADSSARIELPGLFADSIQGDRRVASLFEGLGVSTSFSGNTVVLGKCAASAGLVEADLGGQPDLAQTLVATCAGLNRSFRFTGLSNLKIKETDRLSALCAELRKLGFLVAIADDDALVWDGSRVEPQSVPVICTYDDHRMAMAFAPLAVLNGGITISDPQVVSKSYPRYWDDLRKAGFGIAAVDE